MTGAPHVVLRTPQESDADLRYRLESELATWEERNPGRPAPLPRADWDRRAADDGTDRPVRFIVEADGEAVGGVSLFGFDDLARHAEIGITLVPEARGRGIGSAAVALIAEFAFVRCNVRRVHLEVIASNEAAIRAYRRAGLVVEGRQREHAWVRGAYEDIVRMGLLRSEWRSAAPAVSTPRGT